MMLPKFASVSEWRRRLLNPVSIFHHSTLFSVSKTQNQLQSVLFPEKDEEEECLICLSEITGSEVPTVRCAYCKKRIGCDSVILGDWMFLSYSLIIFQQWSNLCICRLMKTFILFLICFWVSNHWWSDFRPEIHGKVRRMRVSRAQKSEEKLASFAFLRNLVSFFELFRKRKVFLSSDENPAEK